MLLIGGFGWGTEPLEEEFESSEEEFESSEEEPESGESKNYE